MMRGTQWKAFIEKTCIEMEQLPEDAPLLKTLGVDRGAALAQRVFELFPQYAESHPILSERFQTLLKNWKFRSHLEFMTPEQVLEVVMEYDLQL